MDFLIYRNVTSAKKVGNPKFKITVKLLYFTIRSCDIKIVRSLTHDLSLISPWPNGNLVPVGPPSRAKRLGPALDDDEGHVSNDSPALYQELYGSVPAPENVHLTNVTSNI